MVMATGVRGAIDIFSLGISSGARDGASGGLRIATGLVVDWTAVSCWVLACLGDGFRCTGVLLLCNGDLS